MTIKAIISYVLECIATLLPYKFMSYSKKRTPHMKAIKGSNVIDMYVKINDYKQYKCPVCNSSRRDIIKLN